MDFFNMELVKVRLVANHPEYTFNVYVNNWCVWKTKTLDEAFAFITTILGSGFQYDGETVTEANFMVSQ